ncbi:DUF4058 family protein [Nostoc sp.]|uniref:DUF4058 family protein n=1 Tax=Nostoc sp. TaxID=1180 RepID=UPI002FF6B557
MNSPFPGMNPYLENPVFWSEVHHRLITAIADTIEQTIPPQYRVAIEQRTYLSDEHTTENYLEIREVSTGFVVTSIEILSPKNKRVGEGRKAYKLKCKQVLASTTRRK